MESKGKQDSFLNLLSSMDEERYLRIASTILGTVPMPFNKQMVGRKLLSFFMNDENRRSIAASIADHEKPMLRLIGMLGHASASQLEAFCCNTNPYMLALQLDGLCDRLVLFRTDNGFLVNPIIEDDMEGLCLHAGVSQQTRAKRPLVDQNVLRAVMNLLVNGSVPQRDANVHHFYKSGRLETVFPQFSQRQRMFELLRGLVVKAHAVDRAGSHMTVDREAAKPLLSMASIDICMAALDSWYGANAPKAIGDALRVLAGYQMDVDRLSRFVLATAPIEDPAGLVQDMEALGLVCRSDGNTQMLSLNEALHEPQIGMSSLTIDSNLSVSYYGIPKENDILYLIADVQKCDNLVEYSITKGSFSRALGFGIARDEMERYLGDDSVHTTLQLWEKSASRVKLYDGIVLQCSQEVSFLLENIPELSSCIIARIGDGVFIMKRSREELWKGILAKALDMDELPMPLCEDKCEEERPGVAFKHYELPVCKVKREDQLKQQPLDWEEVKENLLAYAEQEGCLSPELEYLVETRRIVSKSQISKAFRYERLQSAGGLDFNAKLALIKKAISRKEGQSFKVMKLELLDEEVLVVPVSIQGAGSRSMLKAIVLPSGNERTIPISTVFQATLVRSL